MSVGAEASGHRAAAQPVEPGETASRVRHDPDLGRRWLADVIPRPKALSNQREVLVALDALLGLVAEVIEAIRDLITQGSGERAPPRTARAPV